MFNVLKIMKKQYPKGMADIDNVSLDAGFKHPFFRVWWREEGQHIASDPDMLYKV